MAYFSGAEYHHHLRKRIHISLEEYPHPNKWKNLLDKLIYPVSLLGPLMMIPQIAKIYIEKDASSIALTSWIFFGLVSILWILYGLAHKEKVLVVSHSAWVASYIFIITGAFIY
jgi:uncharacterized protein with PQ loop repeat